LKEEQCNFEGVAVTLFDVFLCDSQKNSCNSSHTHLLLHLPHKIVDPHTIVVFIFIMCGVHSKTSVLTGIRFLRRPPYPHEILPSAPRRRSQFPNSRPSCHNRRFARLRRRFSGGPPILQLGHCLVQVPPLHAPLHCVRDVSHRKQKF